MNTLYKIILLSITLSVTSAANATVWTVNTSGFTFTPATITINLGDTVNFVIGGSHNSVEVSQATWNANGSTSNGGFSLPFGGGIFIPTQVKTYFYVCQPHASMGMKGQIIVNSSTGIPNVNALEKQLKFFPNPMSSTTHIQTGFANGTTNSLKIYDLTGKEVMEIRNISHNQKMDVSSLRKGVYFAEFRSEEFRRTTKLVVE